MSKVIRARYEGGVLKPLEPIELGEGEEVLITVKRDIRAAIREYKGILGKASLEELLRLEETHAVREKVYGLTKISDECLG